MPSATAPLPSGSSSPPASSAEADAGFGIYVHWPFCLAMCPYCDFNSHVRADVVEARWCAALLTDLESFANRTGGQKATSVFFGGGTPSLMDPATVAAVIEKILVLWPTGPDLEVTLEANPGAAEAERFAAFAAAGVTRLSIGVQALDDAALSFLGRIHGRAEALAALDRAHAYFPRVSFDLIYARPGQTPAAWKAELDEAISLAGGHLSVYQLTIEPGTAFHTQARLGTLTLPDEETQAVLYDMTQERLAAAGLPAYEISNHARPGEECRQNLTYWRSGPYVGVGPGAHGRVGTGATRRAIAQHRLPETWLAAVERTGHGTCADTPLDVRERREELLVMGLRLTEGIGRTRFESVCGSAPEEVFAAGALADLTEGGFLELDAAGIRATKAGRARLDAVLSRLLA